MYTSLKCPIVDFTKNSQSHLAMSVQSNPDFHKLTCEDILCCLPAFAECPVWKDEDECEKGIHQSFSVGRYASTGFAKAVKMPRVEARGASRPHLSAAFFGIWSTPSTSSRSNHHFFSGLGLPYPKKIIRPDSNTPCQGGVSHCPTDGSVKKGIRFVRRADFDTGSTS